jgi:hypothetical protein
MGRGSYPRFVDGDNTLAVATSNLRNRVQFDCSMMLPAPRIEETEGGYQLLRIDGGEGWLVEVHDLSSSGETQVDLSFDLTVSEARNLAAHLLSAADESEVQ